MTVLITPEVFEATVAESRRRGIRMVGHVDPRVGVARALAVGQQIEHFDNYFESILSDSAPMKRSVSDVGVYGLRNWESLDWIDDRKVERIAGATARAGVPVTPTTAFFVETFAVPVADSVLQSRPDWAHIPPKMRDLYWGARQRYWANPPSQARRDRYMQVRNRLTRAVVDSGGIIFAGSDAPGGLLGYGWTMHRELEHFVRAGLTPYEALQTATVNPARFLGAAQSIARSRRGSAPTSSGRRQPARRHPEHQPHQAVSIGGNWIEQPMLAQMIREAGKRLNRDGRRRESEEREVRASHYPSSLLPPPSSIIHIHLLASTPRHPTSTCLRSRWPLSRPPKHDDHATHRVVRHACHHSRRGEHQRVAAMRCRSRATFAAARLPTAAEEDDLARAAS